MIDSHFASYQEKARIKPNPSNQVFYSKLIRSLAITNKVVVVSHRPFKRGMFKQNYLINEESSSGKIKYFYTAIEGNAFYKLKKEEKEIINTSERAIKEFKGGDFIILSDTLRINLIKAALKIGVNHKTKVIGVLTHNPRNLSNINKLYANNLLNYVSRCDAFISVTQKLVDNINPQITSYVFEGLAQEEKGDKKNLMTKYFFFGGSLFEKYGVKNLVDAYHLSKCKNKLIIAGNGPLNKYIEKMTQLDPRILYIGQISKARWNSYAFNSVANINPRPTNEKLDKESVPSKLLDYLAIGNPTISSRHPLFFKKFKDDATWFDGNSITNLISTLENFEKAKTREELKKAKNAKEKVLKLYGLENQGELITHFLGTLR